MERKRILFISQEIHPYLPENDLSKTALALPKRLNELGHEVRVFMPRFGVINERRHQLHEVIRLSGINIVVNDLDMPLIIKVASVPQARMQVYFIDNDDYFKRKATLFDENNKLFADNDERTVFFAKGVIATVKKLGWKPDIIHLNGWFPALVPHYVKLMNHDDPLFGDSKIVMSNYNLEFNGRLGENLANCLRFDEFDEKVIKKLKKPTYIDLLKSSVDYLDGLIRAQGYLNEDLENYAREKGVPVFDGLGLKDNPAQILSVYNEILIEESVA